jgi:lysophospholipase L1-like esterase
VKIGAVSAIVNAAVSTSTLLTASTGANAAGTYDVVVTNTNGATGRLAAAFTYKQQSAPSFIAAYELAFGDSITAGWTCDAYDVVGGHCFYDPYSVRVSDSRYPPNLQQSLAAFSASVNGPPVTVENQGLPGECATAPCNQNPLTGAQRLGGLLGGPHNLVILLEGVNDLNGGIDPSVIASTLRGMVQNAKANGKLVLLSTLTPDRAPTGDESAPPWTWFGPDPTLIQNLNGQIAAIGSAENVPVVDMYSAFTGDPAGLTALLSADGLHPSDRGYQKITSTLYDAIVANFYIAR